jgi:lipopolysaccharide/colanic/teichoic acid biosynthesis glycosyltransferase
VSRRMRSRSLAFGTIEGAEAFDRLCRLAVPDSRTAQMLVKRGLDVVLALVLLLSLAPAYVLIAAAMWLWSPGPVIFEQVRMGKGGRPFRLYKFRTMASNCDTAIHQIYYRQLVKGEAAPIEGAFKLARDPRVTPVGRVLRRFSLDELPQLWNVLKGEMSLVGPRPPIPYETDLYSAHDWRRLGVKPGLTGLWQVSGRNSRSFQEMIDLDLAYIEHWSIWADVVILFRTPLVVLTGRGAC